MEYEIVELKEKTLVALSARTKNSDENMPQIIGGLWQKFYTPEFCFSIQDKISDKAICTYSEYESDCNSEYSVSVGCEVSKADNLPSGTVEKHIPAGKYAKFVVRGNVQKAVNDFWVALWQMQELPRAYTCDFEEYQDCSMDDAVIHIYISLK